MRAFVFCCLCLSFAAAAEEPAPEALPVIPLAAADEKAVPAAGAPTTLEPITVTATRTPRAVSEVAASVSVVSAREIEFRQASSLGEVFRDLPGVALEGGPRPSAEFINVRGLSGPRVLLIVDGARQNFLGGHRTSLLVDPDLLKQVELLRGPASALWGSDALGGVVVMETKDAQDILQKDESLALRLRGGFESVNDERLDSGFAAGRFGDFDSVLSLTRRGAGNFERADGSEEPNSGQDVRAMLGKLSWLPGQGPHQLGFTHQTFVQDSIAPSNPSTVITATNPLIDRTSDTAYSVLRYGFEGLEQAGPRAAQFNLYRDELFIREDRVGAPRNDRIFFQTDGANGHATLPAPQSWGWSGETLFTLGADGFRDSARATRDGAPRPQFPDADRELAGVFLQAEAPLGALSVVPGIRYDRYEASSNQDGSADVRETAVSPKLGLVYALTEGLKLRGALNSAFRAPGLIEIYAAGQHFLGNNFRPNPELRPEKARNLELGLSLNRRGFSEAHSFTLGGSLYRNRVRDYIEQFVVVESEFPAPRCAVPRPPVGCVNRNEDGTANPRSVPVFVGGFTSSRNLESATLRGGELDSAYGIGGFTFGASYSRTRGKDDSTGQPLLSIAADRLRGRLELSAFGQLRGTLGYTRALAQNRVPTFVDGNGNTRDVIPRTPAYGLWDLNFSYEPFGPDGHRFGFTAPRLVLGVDNLTGEQYRDHLNVLQSPGRNLRGSLSFGF